MQCVLLPVPPPDRCPQIQSFLMDTFQRFLRHDERVSQGNARKIWPDLLDSLYPGLQQVSALEAKLTCLCERVFANRLSDLASSMNHFVELWCGKGNLTLEMLRGGFRGVGFDIDHSQGHNCLNLEGLKLWLDALMSLMQHGLLWMGPPCSSFVILCLAQSLRYPENDFWGDTSRTFVQTGNAHMQVASLCFLIGSVIGVMVCLEQPDNSSMTKCVPLSSVLTFVKACRFKTYLGSFSGPTEKPLQIWSNRACVHQLERECPRWLVSDGLVTRGENGSFTGKKDELVASGVYTRHFGTAVQEVFAAEFARHT